VHTLVTEPTEDLDSWLELVTLCRKERMHSLCENILRKIGAPLLLRKNSDLGDISHGGSTRDPPSFDSPPPPSVQLPPARANDRVMLSTFEYWWAVGEKSRALTELTEYLKVCGVPKSLSSNTRRYSTTEATMFRVECLLKRADWTRELNGNNERGVQDTMSTLTEARNLAGDRYSVWHAWAVANYDYLKKADSKDGKTAAEPETSAAAGFGMPFASNNQPFAVAPPGGTPTQPTKGKSKASRKLGGAASSGSASLLNKLSSQQVDTVTPFIVEAIRGFVRSIILGVGQPVANVLQDTLRLITLWFSYGTKKGVFHILEEELEKISPDHWLAVVPQLIARIHIKSPEISGLLRKLLAKVATAHPQALVCPISVALNTSDVQQRQVATEVLQEMRKSRSQLVEEATMVSRELMRVAITPHELWYDGLEQAAQLYMDTKDIHAMMVVLEDLHDAMSEGASVLTPQAKEQEGFSESIGKIGYTTLRDISFRHCYSKSLHEAQHWLIQFKSSLCTADLHQAWEIYQQLFKRIKVQIVNLKKLELHHVSPALTNAADLSLAVPGTYKPSSADIGIKSFAHFIGVIASKQRPRRMSMLGSDGLHYEFLLKGHEDLRQDERVMQLFGLINACLNNDNLTNNRGLEIVRYSVLPLSNNSGVIGWVQNCDTMNQLIKQYRESKDMRLLIEVKLLHAKCPNYDRLPLMHKVDLFRQVLEETTGKDLAKMLWLKSKTSDVWVERRANFTKSMAVMSMAGYILGLGDRHPSNLMLDRISGRVVHIDFGDCFEITSQRAKFPEIIPFRLTRMLTTCMGPAGIQGSYRLTCERVSFVASTHYFVQHVASWRDQLPNSLRSLVVLILHV
jgi:phosphatidylinositol kinase/protein kinase (PI-3  family)